MFYFTRKIPHHIFNIMFMAQKYLATVYFEYNHGLMLLLCNDGCQTRAVYGLSPSIPRTYTVIYNVKVKVKLIYIIVRSKA